MSAAIRRREYTPAAMRNAAGIGQQPRPRSDRRRPANGREERIAPTPTIDPMMACVVLTFNLRGHVSRAARVTASVTVRSGRDGQDGTGHDRIIEPYPARRAGFRRKIDDLKNCGVRVSRPPPSTTRPSLRIEIAPESADLLARPLGTAGCVAASVTIGTVRDDTGPRDEPL